MSVALASLPVLAWLAAGLLVFERSRATRTLREALLCAAVLAAGWLVLGTELLSACHAVRRGPILLWWAIPALALTLALARRRRRRSEWPCLIPRPGPGQGLLILALAFLLGWSFCQAVFAPPNNVDSLSYHLPRQVYWSQQGSVENYPTSSLRQIAMPPLTEFAGLHLMVLTGGDRLHNLVQWTAFVLTLAAVSLITRQFGGTTTAQLLSMLWVATIPMAFLQASNTKNDVVVALWTCVLLLWVIRLRHEPSLSPQQGVLVGLAFGALVLTKGTGIIFGVPIAGLMLALLRHQRGRALTTLLLVAAVALAVNTGAFLRNIQAFGTPLPRDPAIHGGDSVVNQDFSAAAILSNVVRNLAPHFTTPSQRLNDRLTELVMGLHARLGIDADDPRTTWRESGFRAYSFTQGSEDTAAAPAHIWWLLVLLVVATLRRPAAGEAAPALWLVLLAAFLLFSVSLKWQVWHVRLVIALAVWAAPLFGWAFAAAPLSRVAALPALTLLVGLLPSLNVPQRPLLGQWSIFTNDAAAVRFYPETDRGRTMAKQAERMNQLLPRIVGIATGWSFVDYQVQRALLDGMSPPPTFTAFNASLQIAGKPEPDPDVLLVGDARSERLRHRSTGTWYVRLERLRPYELFVREGPPASSRPTVPPLNEAIEPDLLLTIN